MSYQALYRKYRPRTFSEVVGQSHITTILKNQAASGRTSHAYLFTGTRGTGKTSTAKIFARAINCSSPTDGEPCGKCEACETSGGANADIIEMDAASNSGVDDVRAIIEKARFMPLELSKKVYIIDEAHALSKSAFNALLKTLEEPPEHVVFILATTEPQQLPATIISRCQRFDFHRLTVQDMVSRMKEVLSSSNVHIDEQGLIAIARAAEGGMRDALSLADQCLAFCGDNVTSSDVYGILGSMDGSFLFDMADALIDSDAQRALRLLDRVVSDGRDLTVLVHDLALHMRALLFAKLCGHCADVLDCTDEDMKRYMAQAQRCGQARLLTAGELLLETQSNLRWLTLPRVLIESTLVRIARPSKEDSTQALEERLEVLEQKLAQAAVCAPPVNSAQPVHDTSYDVYAPPAEAFQTDEDMPPWDIEPPLEPEPAAEGLREAAVERVAPKAAEQTPRIVPEASSAPCRYTAQSLFSAMLERLKAEDMSVYVMWMRGKPLSLSGTILNVAFETKVYRDALNSPQIKAKLDACADALLSGCSVNCVAGGADSSEDKARSLFGAGLTVE